MKWKFEIYRRLVNANPDIREKYEEYKKNNEKNGISAWIYLLYLNFRVHFLKEKVGNAPTYSDKNKSISSCPESKKALVVRPEVLSKEIGNYDIVLLDVFDTLVLRKFVRPEDVFYLVQQKLKYPDFKRIRIEAEQIARKKRYNDSGDCEVSYAEIWTVLEKITGIKKEVGIRTEWEAEIESCYANPYFVKLIDILKREHKTLVICSDMYWGQEKVAELLSRCGYPMFDDYFISSDYRHSKNDGMLYEIIKNKYGNSKRYVHIGDNRYSDVIMARKRGVKGVYYHNVHLIGRKFRACDMSPLMYSIYSGIVNGVICNGLQEKTLLYELGYIYGGILVTGYCQFIHKYVKEHQIDKILFLARDGEIIQKAYELMYEEEREKCNYVYWSRLAGIKMCTPYFKTLYIRRMIEDKVNQKYTLLEIMDTMQLLDMLNPFIEWVEREYSEFSELDRGLAKKLVEYISSNWEEVCKHYDKEREEGRKYYTNIVQDAKKVVAIDIGWAGSGPLFLRYLFKSVWNMNCTITGILAGTTHNSELAEVEYACGDIESYMFSARHNRDLWKKHDDSLGHNLLLELILSSEQYTFQGFLKDEDGHYQFEHSREKINSSEIQQGILDFVRDYMNHPFANIEISGRDAAAPLNILYNNKRWIEQIISNSGIKANIE